MAESWPPLLPTEQVADEEELAAPVRSRAQRLRLQLAAAVLALVAVAAAATAMSHHQRTPKKTPRTPPVIAAPAVDALQLPNNYVTTRQGQQSIPRDRITCPAQTECITSATLSAGARKAVDGAFPSWTIFAVRTVRMSVPNYGDALVALDIDAEWGDEARLVVRLRGRDNQSPGRGGGANGTDFLIVGPNRITRYETKLYQYDVTVAVIRPPYQRQPVEPLRQLAHDGRLLDIN